MAEKFLIKLLKFFFTKTKASLEIEIDKLNELIKFNENSRFLILPTKKNIIPLQPDKETNFNNFSPFEKDPAYILKLQPNYKKYSSINQPVLIEFLCQSALIKFRTKFILKKADNNSKEIFVGNFINFLNRMLTQDKFLREKSMKLPSYSIIQLAKNIVCIEFLENTSAFDRIYSSYLAERSENLAKARK